MARLKVGDVLEVVAVTLVTAMAVIAVYLAAKLEADKMEAARMEAARLEEAKKALPLCVKLFQKVWEWFVQSRVS